MEDEILNPSEGHVEIVEPQTEAIVEAESNIKQEEGATDSTIAESKTVQDKETNSAFAELRRKAEAAEQRASQLELNHNLAKEYGAEFGVYSVEDISRLYGENGIHTLDDFKEAVKRQKMIEEGKDPDLEWAREQRQKHEETQKNWNDFLQLKEDFPEIKNPEDIPAEVIEIKEKRKCSFSDAMARYELNQAKAKLNEFAKGTKTQEANSNNAQSSTGSVGGQGNPPPATLTDEVINSMTDKERASKWGEIKKFYGMK